MSMVTSEVFDENMILAGLGVGSGGSGAAPTPLVGMKMHLFTNALIPSKINAVSDYVEPTYTGYAAKTVSWGLPKRDVNNLISTDTGLVPWQMQNSATPTAIQGYFMTDSTGTVYLMGEVLPTPVTLIDALGFLGIVSEFAQSNATRGQCTVVS
jgi:hypothetical protein